ncbi:hypothetical protein FLAV_02195 [Flavobacteriales bacterium]|nr:hypothetical protein FLAV_02195 [Flavobacteriales bacterium]
MTGDQGHRNDTTNGQRVSRHSLPTLLYFLFSPPHIFFNSNLCRPANGTLAFAPIAQANPSGKSQRAVFANAPTEHSENKGDFFLILTNSNFQSDGIYFQLIQDYGF